MSHLDWGLEGQTVIVTGGAGAIGRAVCEGFAEAGASVAVVDIDRAAVDAVASMLPRAKGFGANLTDFARLPALISRIEDQMGLATHLVNIAGIIRRTADLFTVTEADWDAQVDVNLKAMFFLTQGFAARLRDEGQAGSVVNYTSQGWQSGGFGGSVVYNATKGAVTTMTRGMARSWAPMNIRVNAVAPGLVDTPMMQGTGQTPEQFRAMVETIPMKRLALPDDHVGATVFLCSPMARYMTGACVNVSGGFLMY